MTAEQLREQIANIEQYARTKLDEVDDIKAACFAITAVANSLGQLAASLSGMAADTWQPIETAELIRDKEVWAFNGEQQRMQWFDLHAEDPDHPPGSGLWIYSDETLNDICPEPQQPTHWRELPAAPEPPHV